MKPYFQNNHSDILPEEEITSREANFEPIESHDTLTRMLRLQQSMKKNEEAITEPASLPALRLSTPQCSAPKAGLER